MDKFEEISAIIIDKVEETIRKKHHTVNEYAESIVLEDGVKPNTLLYGETYFELEDEIAKMLRKFFRKLLYKNPEDLTK
ncbi:MAG: hypothetical protein QXT26_07060 [Thermoproteota archaeon]